MTRKKLLSIFLSHPIQHYVPWFQAMSDRLDGRMNVYFASRHGLENTHDPEFGENFAWDMDLLSGYAHEFDKRPKEAAGPDRGFWGIRFRNARELLQRDRPQAVMVFGWLFAGYWEAAWAAKRSNIPYLLRGESNLLNKGSAPKWWVKNQTVGRMCRSASVCLAIGKRNAELYRAYGVLSKRIRIAPYFVDNDLFALESARLCPERVRLREQLGLPGDAVVFLFMGKLIEKKHPDHLLRAWESLPESMRNKSAILFAGSGTMKARLEMMAGENPRIVFTGFLNRKQLPEAYAASDVLVLPSDAGETWGLVVNEAMASGLPALVSDSVGCAADLVIEGETGLIFPYGQIKQLGCALAAMIVSADERLRMAKQARKHIAMATANRAADTVRDVLSEMS